MTTTDVPSMETQVRSLAKVQAYRDWLAREREAYAKYKQHTGDDADVLKSTWLRILGEMPPTRDQDWRNARFLDPTI